MKNTSPHFVLFLLILILFSEKVYSQNTTISVNVGVVLDTNTAFGKMGWNSINMALTDFYVSHPDYKTRLVLHTRDFEKDDVVGAAAAALSLIKNEEVKAILGPDSSMQTDPVIDLGDKAHVPIITFSATSPSLSSSKSPYFFRAALNDSAQVQAISSIIKAFGWREVVPIYVDNEYGAGVIPYLTDALQMIDVRVPYRSVIPPLATDDQIEKKLNKLMTMQTRVFVVHMLEDLGARVFKMAEKIGMMSDGYVWIVTNGVTDTLNLIKPSVIVNSMQGVLGVKAYVPKSKALDNFEVRWKKTDSNLDLSIFTLWAYDATFALAMAIEKVNPTTFTYLKNTNTSNTLTDLETLGTSQSGIELRKKLSTTQFKGLAGDFNLVGGHLQPSVFQLINVRGNGENVINGFWSPRNISTKSEVIKSSPYTTSKDDLLSILWPGETMSVPRGWDIIPINGKTLKIGVPVKVGFKDFVSVTKNASTNALVFDGYCIDVFNAVMRAMPYNVTYNFSAFEFPNGNSYDDLIYKLYLREYDAVVGDMTILPNRSKYVDFALPYLESGVSLVVPIKDNKSKSLFVFMQPWSWNLWLATGFFFVFIGFVTWVLEHRINENFRGPPSFQAATIFWFSFSTMGFAHKENVLSGRGRFVVAIWLFVVLILTQSYTASLTTMLTVQQLKPTFTDVYELIKTGDYVGYLRDSFVLEVLKNMHFDESKIRVYNSSEECHELLRRGSANGGIAAAFDETPYMRLFLGHHCSKYTMVGPVYKTAGFGFSFPRGSPLVTDVSRAVLKVREGDEMVKIQKKWFDSERTCQDLSTLAYSNRLGLDTYWVLFVIAAACSLLALLAYVVTLFNDHRRALAKPNSKPTTIFQHFFSKDEDSHTFRRSEKTQNTVDHVYHIDGMNNTDQSSQHNDIPPQSSPSCGSLYSASETAPGTPSSHVLPHTSPTSGNPSERVHSFELIIRSHDEERQGEITVISDEEIRR